MEPKDLLLIAGNLEGRPTGGVTMHVHRLIKRLLEPYVPNYVLCDYKKEGFFEQLTKIRNADVMHIHASNPYLKLFYVIVGKLLFTRSIITLHGKYGVYGDWKNFIHKIALKRCDVPILINQESYEAVKRINKNAVFSTAFIPPIEEEESLSDEMYNKIKEIKANGNPLFVTNASSRAYMDDGREIYGIEFLISYFGRHKEYNLVVLDPNNEYYYLNDNSSSENTWIFAGKNSFYGLVKIADVVIRNTSTDGDSFSVKEALFLHKPVLATDSVSRPDGTFLFKYNDENTLDLAIEQLFSRKDYSGLSEMDATQIYRKLYIQYGVIIPS